MDLWEVTKCYGLQADACVPIACNFLINRYKSGQI